MVQPTWPRHGPKTTNKVRPSPRRHDAVDPHSAAPTPATPAMDTIRGLAPPPAPPGTHGPQSAAVGCDALTLPESLGVVANSMLDQSFSSLFVPKTMHNQPSLYFFSS